MHREDIPLATPCPKGPHGIHLWGSGDGWGVIIGVSRCKFCNELSRREHFHSLRQIVED
jgi:hypothetical protein